MIILSDVLTTFGNLNPHKCRLGIYKVKPFPGKTRNFALINEGRRFLSLPEVKIRLNKPIPCSRCPIQTDRDLKRQAKLKVSRLGNRLLKGMAFVAVNKKIPWRKKEHYLNSSFTI